MNDYDWVAAESAEQANEQYKKEYNYSKEEQPIEKVKEESIDKIFLVPIEDAIGENKIMNFEIKKVGKTEFYKMPFSYSLSILKDIDFEEPFIAGSTEQE